MSMKSRKKVVVIGGGTGVFTLLTGLKKYFEAPTAIVTMADDGGSTGVLREDFGILPPGDVRRALVALSESDNEMLSTLFNYRFDAGKGLKGHSFGNLILTALERITGRFDKAIEEAGKLLAVNGRVIPVALRPTRLSVELENGAIIRGETNIDVPKHDGRLQIMKAWLTPGVPANKEALRAIAAADLIVIGPGDLYTSIIPNLLARGIPAALKSTRGKVAYMVNLMTKFGETNGFRAADFVQTVERYTGPGVLDYIVLNNHRPSPARLRAYTEEGANYVKSNLSPAASERWIPINADLLRPRGFLRHDPDKTARILRRLVK